MRIEECQGIITLRDVRVAIARYGVDSLKIKIGDVMSRKLITVNLNSTSGEAGKIMDKKAIDHLPVVDEGGEIKGIVSSKDLIYVYVGTPVKDRMTKEIITAPATLSIAEAVKIMNEKNIASLLVKS